jgi:hypothetical protein
MILPPAVAVKCCAVRAVAGRGVGSCLLPACETRPSPSLIPVVRVCFCVWCVCVCVCVVYVCVCEPFPDFCPHWVGSMLLACGASEFERGIHGTC